MITGSIEINLDMIFERIDSPHMPWEIIEDLTDYPEDFHEWDDYSAFFEAEVWTLPIDPIDVPIGAKVELKGPAKITFSKYSTEYGEEYDADLIWGATLKCGII